MGIEDYRADPADPWNFKVKGHPEPVIPVPVTSSVPGAIKPTLVDLREIHKGVDLIMAENIVKEAEDKAKEEAAKVEAAAKADATKVEADVKAVASSGSSLVSYWPYLAALVAGAAAAHFLHL